MAELIASGSSPAVAAKRRSGTKHLRRRLVDMSREEHRAQRAVMTLIIGDDEVRNTIECRLGWGPHLDPSSDRTLAMLDWADGPPAVQAAVAVWERLPEMLGTMTEEPTSSTMLVPVHDAGELDARRRAIGLPPLDHDVREGVNSTTVAARIAQLTDTAPGLW